jgi:hypothetical protein
MPLLIITLVGLLAFGLFDLTLGRPLSVGAQSAIRHKLDLPLQPVEPEPMLSLQKIAALQIERCEATDKACQLSALYQFILEAVNVEPPQALAIHPRQSPLQTLLKKTGDAADIALLFASLLDQRHIRNYLIVLPQDSYVLACDISPTALRHAGGNWRPIIPSPESSSSNIVNDQAQQTDAFQLNLADAACPCLLLDPSGSQNRQLGDPIPVPIKTFRWAVDRLGQRHALLTGL